MILRRLLLTPEGEQGNGGGGENNAPAPAKPASNTPTQVKISVGKEAPAAVKAMTFSADPGLLENPDKVGFKIEDTSKPNVDVKPIEEPVRTAQPPEPVKKEEKEEGVKPTAAKTQPQQVKKEEHKPAEPAPIMPKKKGEANAPVKEFDYTGFNDDEATALRQMSTAGREFTVKLIKQNKELSQVKTGMFAQHPDAYVIDPDFRALQDDQIFAEQEARIWQEQLKKIEAGDEWTPLRGFDKQGNPVFGDKRKPTADDKYQVGVVMNRAFNTAEQKRGELQHFAATYQNRVKSDLQLIQAERAKRFGWVGNPEILKETVELDTGVEQTVEQIRQYLIGLFPPYMRNTLPVEVAADLFVALQIQGQNLREASKGTQAAQTQAREAARAEPTGHSRGNGSEGGGREIGGIKEFSLAGMPR